jgi:hypothetical protein
MFLRAYHRTKNGKRHTYFALVESKRTVCGPRQHKVAELGELSVDEQRRWERTAIFHSRGGGEGRQLTLLPDDESVPLPDDPDVVRVRLGKVGWTNARAFGDVWLGLELWRQLGLDRIVARHIPAGRETVSPALCVAIEVISRLCVGQGGPTSEFGLAEHGYRRTALEDLLGVPDAEVTKDRLYRTLDALLKAKEPIERDLKARLGELFSLDFDLLLCDLTSSFFEGLAEDNEEAQRGYSRDHRSDCKQVVLALIVTQDGFPLYHQVFSGNTPDGAAFPKIVETLEQRFGTARRVWVLDRGLASVSNLEFLKQRQQSFLVGTPRSQLTEFEAELSTRDFQQIRRHVEVKCVQRDGQGTSHSPAPVDQAASGPRQALSHGVGRPAQGCRQGAAAHRSTQRALAGGLAVRADAGVQRSIRAGHGGEVDLSPRQAAFGPGPRWSVPAAVRSNRLVGRATVGHLYAVGSGGGRHRKCSGNFRPQSALAPPPGPIQSVNCATWAKTEDVHIALLERQIAATGHKCWYDRQTMSGQPICEESCGYLVGENRARGGARGNGVRRWEEATGTFQVLGSPKSQPLAMPPLRPSLLAWRWSSVVSRDGKVPGTDQADAQPPLLICRPSGALSTGSATLPSAYARGY